jgi:NAD-dependent SIR2 family protein deacetylase
VEVGEWIEKDRVDLMLVIGTTATVWPAAGYVDKARSQGAKIAVINMDGLDGELGAASTLTDDDFLFQGDAAKILPEILKPIIGELEAVE